MPAKYWTIWRIVLWIALLSIGIGAVCSFLQGFIDALWVAIAHAC